MKLFFTNKGFLLLICIIFSACTFSAQAAFESDIGSIGSIGKTEAVHDMARELIRVGVEQYDKALFDAAEKSFLKARQYKKYLDDEELIKLNKYLRESSAAALRRQGIVEHIMNADELVRQGHLIRAKAHLKAIEKSPLLTDREKKLVKEGLGKIEDWLKGQKKQIEEIYNKSVELFNSGQLENARAGFIKVAKNGLMVLPDGETAEDYIHKIDSTLGKTKGPLTITDIELYQKKTEMAYTVPEGTGLLLNGEQKDKPSLDIIQPKKTEAEYFDSINRRRSLIRGYTKAIVDDGIIKARNYIDIGKYYQAEKELEQMQKAIDQHRLYLEDDFYTQSSQQIHNLGEEIKKGREKWLGGIDGWPEDG